MTRRLRNLGLLSFSFIFCATLPALGAIDLNPYYGTRLSNYLEDKGLLDLLVVDHPFTEAYQEPQSLKVKNEIYRILSQFHIEVAGGRPDRIVDKCEGKYDCFRHQHLSYRQARTHLFGELHLFKRKGRYGVRDVYCQKDFFKKDFPDGKDVGPGKIPNSNVINAEHTWPQSRFSLHQNKNAQKSDLHAIFPAGHRINAVRGNHRFADVDAPKYQSCNGTTIGHGPEGKDIFFEPPEVHKGNVARAIFYFSVRYRLPITPVEEKTLRRWHQLDPIDWEEEERHEGIFQIQDVRNPFIDHPELIDEIENF